MDASQVQTLFRQAVARDDDAAFRQGLEGFLGTDVMACPLRASTRCGARTW